MTSTPSSGPPPAGDDVPHPLHRQILAATPGPATTVAVAAVLDRHQPTHWGPDRDWVVCAECAVLSWPPPPNPREMWTDVVYPCATVADVAAALGVPVPDPHTTDQRSLGDLTARFGLGVAEAVLLRAAVPDDAARTILDRSRNQVGTVDRRRTDLGRLPDPVRSALWQAFADGADPPPAGGPGDAHWTAGVDRMLLYLARVGLLRDTTRPTPTRT